MGLFQRKPPPPLISAVIVAAGSASRMGGIDKQQVLLEGVPVVVHSIGQFEQCPIIGEIVVVCREEQIAAYYRLVQEYDLQKVASVVKGGAHRQESVFNGIEACAPHTDFYAIHDGARPLVSRWEIEQCVAAALACGAAAVGTRVKDTIKICAEDGFILSTPAREQLVAVGTPQIFAAELYREAMEQAKNNHCLYTDDCQLVERTGSRVAIAPGSYENIKITTPEDLALAQAILHYRAQGGAEWQDFE